MMERKFVYNQNLKRTLQTRNVYPVRQLKKIVDNRASMLRQFQMLTQFRANPAGAAPAGIPAASLNYHASTEHVRDSDTVAALAGHGLNFANNQGNQAAVLAFINANPTKNNGIFRNILLDGASNPNPSPRNPSQWLGYVVKRNGSVIVTHIGPFGESPNGLAAQL